MLIPRGINVYPNIYEWKSTLTCVHYIKYHWRKLSNRSYNIIISCYLISYPYTSWLNTLIIRGIYFFSIFTYLRVYVVFSLNALQFRIFIFPCKFHEHISQSKKDELFVVIDNLIHNENIRNEYWNSNITTLMRHCFIRVKSNNRQRNDYIAMKTHSIKNY